MLLVTIMAFAKTIGIKLSLSLKSRSAEAPVNLRLAPLTLVFLNITTEKHQGL
jgi:hypothetical protein